MKFFEACKARAAKEEQKNLQYLSVGLVTGSARRIVDESKRPWHIVANREHTAAKVALVPLATIWDLYLFLGLPISVVTVPIFLELTRIHVDLKDMQEEEQMDEGEQMDYEEQDDSNQMMI